MSLARDFDSPDCPIRHISSEIRQGSRGSFSVAAGARKTLHFGISINHNCQLPWRSRVKSIPDPFAQIFRHESIDAHANTTPLRLCSTCANKVTSCCCYRRSFGPHTHCNRFSTNHESLDEF